MFPSFVGNFFDKNQNLEIPKLAFIICNVFNWAQLTYFFFTFRQFLFSNFPILSNYIIYLSYVSITVLFWSLLWLEAYLI